MTKRVSARSHYDYDVEHLNLTPHGCIPWPVFPNVQSYAESLMSPPCDVHAQNFAISKSVSGLLTALFETLFNFPSRYYSLSVLDYI